MKSNMGKFIAAISILFLFTACTPMIKHNIVQNDTTYHHAELAKQHENLAKEMMTKAREQNEILKNKPRTSYFGRNGQHIKKRIAQRIRIFKKAAEINLAKAAAHKKIVQNLEKQKLFSEPGITNEQTNKVKFRSNSPSSAEETENYKESL